MSLMAGIAIRGHFCALDVLGLVAIVAANGRMGAVQRIFCILVVIEDDTFPAQRTVTVFANIGKAAFVRVLLAMAGKAIRGRAFERPAVMAAFAGHKRMEA